LGQEVLSLKGESSIEEDSSMPAKKKASKKAAKKKSK
jgi:hypothetical protein